MLHYGLLKNHAGILLCGDYSTLRALHDVVHEVNEKSPLVKNKAGDFLGLAYDLRKAYERSREVLPPPEHSPEIGTRYGVQILWPMILFQCTMLRDSLSFMPSTTRQQGLTYLLESIIESALDDDFGAKAEEILYQWGRLSTRHPWAADKIDSRCAQYCAWTKPQRKVGLAGLLMSLDAMYPATYPLYSRRGDAVPLVSPEELAAWEGLEWPDPKW
jgi:hypothetical protein